MSLVHISPKLPTLLATSFVVIEEGLRIPENFFARSYPCALSFLPALEAAEESVMPVGPNDLETARKLFEEGGWGSGDPLGPDQWFAEDAVMRDIVGHPNAMRGKAAIRKFWASQKVGITLRVPVEELYVAEGHRGVAVLWMAYGQITDEEDENYARWATFEGMSRLEFNDAGEVTLEVDYHHGTQGFTDSWVAHWNARRARPWRELGEITGG